VRPYGSAVTAVQVCVVLVVALGALVGCTQSAPPASEQADAIPDLTAFVANLTSPDPSVQERALAPSVRAAAGEAPGVLPPGSTVTLAPSTWSTRRVDDATDLDQATIRATVIRPNEPPADFRLLLVRVGDQWLLYDSSAL
jgi:hypothetical protein